MTRKDIEEHTVAFLRTARGTRPDLRVVEIDGRRTVVKDFRRSDPLFRLLVGPVLIRRERGALARLSGIGGVPKHIETIDRYAFAIERIEGSSLRKFTGQIPDGFFDRLADIVRRVHERGVAYCDLRSSGNVVVAAGGEPYIVDFAACITRGRGLNPLINFLFRQFSQADNYGVLVLKRKHAPDQLSQKERLRLETPAPYERIAVKIGTSIRKIARRLLTRS